MLVSASCAHPLWRLSTDSLKICAGKPLPRIDPREFDIATGIEVGRGGYGSVRTHLHYGTCVHASTSPRTALAQPSVACTRDAHTADGAATVTGQAYRRMQPDKYGPGCTVRFSVCLRAHAYHTARMQQAWRMLGCCGLVAGALLRCARSECHPAVPSAVPLAVHSAVHRLCIGCSSCWGVR